MQLKPSVRFPAGPRPQSIRVHPERISTIDTTTKTARPVEADSLRQLLRLMDQTAPDVLTPRVRARETRPCQRSHRVVQRTPRFAPGTFATRQPHRSARESRAREAQRIARASSLRSRCRRVTRAAPFLRRLEAQPSILQPLSY